MKKIIKTNSGISDKVADAIIELLGDTNDKYMPLMDRCDTLTVEVEGKDVEFKYGFMNGDWNTVVVVINDGRDGRMNIDRSALYLKENPMMEVDDEDGNSILVRR